MVHILVVDDDSSMLSFLTKALENAGYQVTAKNNGLDALDILKNAQDIDLLLTDVVMPGMDGTELSHEAQKINPTIKIMFITGFSAATLSTKKISHINGTIIAKPFHLNDLIARIKASLAE